MKRWDAECLLMRDGLKLTRDDVAATNVPPMSTIVGRYDERRVHVQAYQYWQSRRQGNALPRFSDCADFATMPFARRMVLIEIEKLGADAEVRFVGESLEAAARPGQHDAFNIFETLLQSLDLVVATAAPVGFEADIPLISSADADYAFRGVLLPLSDDSGKTSFVIGVINWRKGRVEDTCNDVLEKLLGNDLASINR